MIFQAFGAGKLVDATADLALAGVNARLGAQFNLANPFA